MSVRSARFAKALRAGEVDGEKRSKLTFAEREGCRYADLVLNNEFAILVIVYELRLLKKARST